MVFLDGEVQRSFSLGSLNAKCSAFQVENGIDDVSETVVGSAMERCPTLVVLKIEGSILPLAEAAPEQGKSIDALDLAVFTGKNVHDGFSAGVEDVLLTAVGAMDFFDDGPVTNTKSQMQGAITIGIAGENAVGVFIEESDHLVGLAALDESMKILSV